MPRSAAAEGRYAPHHSMRRVIERIVETNEGRNDLWREFRRDMQRNPIWDRLEPQTRDDLQNLYGAMRSLGFDMCIDRNRGRHRDFLNGDEGACIILRYGHREWAYPFSPGMMERHADAQAHMVECVVTGAQQLFIEVGLDNVLSGDPRDRVMPTRPRMGGGAALRYAATDRIFFEDLDRNPPLTVDRQPPRRDRPGFNAVIRDRPAPPRRVEPPTTAELRETAGIDLDHMTVDNELLEDVPERTFGPSESALEESYRV